MRTALHLSIVVFLACSSAPQLTPAEKAKLDASLLALLQGGKIAESDYAVSSRPDGAIQYAVLIRSTNPEELRSAGIVLQAVVGDIVTAHVTKKELRNIAGLPSVRAVENSVKDLPNNP